jgi:hypothetical protein
MAEWSEGHMTAIDPLNWDVEIFGRVWLN